MGDTNIEEQYQILIVDDIAENLQVLGNILSDKGYNIGYATNGAQALEAADHSEPDLILLDISMPEMDGFEVCKQLKDQDKTKHIPVIFLTARTESEDIVNGFSVGAVDYITKPFNPPELITRVNTHLNLSRSKKLIEQQNEELKALNNSKDKFFSLIAHDLKGPLNGLVGLSSILLKKDDLLDDKEVDHYHKLLFEASKHGLNLLENLLDWSRSQTGRIQFNPDNYDLVELVQDKISLLRANAEHKKISIKEDLPDLAQSYCDHNMISGVIRNLLSNAIKFTPKHGEITVGISDEKDHWKVWVKDTGVGLTDEERSKLFRLDAHHTTRGTDNEKGTGLGLLLCKEFTEKNGGTIWVESKKYKGSTFNFTVPKNQ